MSNCVGLFGARDLNHPFGDERARDAGAKKILILVNRAGLDHREDEVAGEFFGQIFDEIFRGAGLQLLAFQPLELFLLTDVCAESDDFGPIILLKLAENNGSVETAGIRENDFHVKL